jgi:hypothetical protein
MDFAILVEALWNQFGFWSGGDPPISAPFAQNTYAGISRK